MKFLMWFVEKYHFPSKDFLEKPLLKPCYSVVLDDLSIYISPNVGKFENEFCKLLAEDKQDWDRIEIDPNTILITERRLKVNNIFKLALI